MNQIDAATMKKLQSKFGDSVTTVQLQAFDRKIYSLANGGALPKIRRGVYSLNGESVEVFGDAAPETPKMSREEMSNLIDERFKVLSMLSDGMIQGNIRSMIVSGAAGVGKSFTQEQKLAAAEKANEIKTAVALKGSISAIGLYVTLYENSKKGQVLVMDDADEIYNDEEALNLLKGALDTGKKRQISWMKDSSFLREREIPQTFEYEGQIVFITNKDMDGVIQRGGKMAPHMSALLSRAVFLDLAIHTNEQIMIRVEQVLKTPNMAKDLELSASQTVQVLDWMTANLNNLRSVSLRSVIQIASFMKTMPKEWEMLARTTMLKKVF